MITKARKHGKDLITRVHGILWCALLIAAPCPYNTPSPSHLLWCNCKAFLLKKVCYVRNTMKTQERGEKAPSNYPSIIHRCRLCILYWRACNHDNNWDVLNLSFRSFSVGHCVPPTCTSFPFLTMLLILFLSLAIVCVPSISPSPAAFYQPSND